MVAFVRSTISQSGDGLWYISGAPVGDADIVRFGLVTDGCPIDEDPMDRNFEGAYLIFEINGSVVTRHYWDSAEDEDDEYWDEIIETITEDYDGSSPIKIWLEQTTGEDYSYAYINYTIFDDYPDDYKSIRPNQVWHIWGSSQGNESGVTGDFEFQQGDGWELFPWGSDSTAAVPWNHDWTPPPPPEPFSCTIDMEKTEGLPNEGDFVQFPITMGYDFGRFEASKTNGEWSVGYGGPIPGGLPNFLSYLYVHQDSCSGQLKVQIDSDSLGEDESLAMYSVEVTGEDIHYTAYFDSWGYEYEGPWLQGTSLAQKEFCIKIYRNEWSLLN